MSESKPPSAPINSADGDPMDYRCASCGAAVPGVAELCPRCGASLASTDGMVAEFRPPLPRAARITALVVLIVFALMAVFAIVATMFD